MKWLALLWSALSLAPSLAITTANAAAANAATTIDDAGERVAIPSAPCRIVSLAPGTTAMLYAAGAGHCLVGTIAHSDEPAEARELTRVGDAETLDLEQLLGLRPTAVVVSVDVVQRARIDRIKALKIPVYQVHVTSLAGMPDSLERLGAFTGTRASARAKAVELRAQLAALAALYRGRPPIRVLYQIWDRPIYTVGGRHVISDALRLCGASNIFAELGTAAPAVTREAAVLRDPEVILASAPPGSAEQWLEEWRKFPTLTAVRRKQLLVYSDQRMDRMGPSVIAAAGDLCRIIEAARPAVPAAN